MNISEVNLSIASANRTAQAQFKFALDNLPALRKADKHGKKEAALISMNQQFEQSGKLTPAQYNYLDGIYEATWRGMGEESIRVSHKNRSNKT